MKSITTIDEVIAILDEIIEECLTAENTLGYFAVLYQKVTIKVKEEIAAGIFDDGPRMEKLDVIFAKRYIDAYFAWKNKQTVTSSWEVAFTEAQNSNLIVLQHLLLGMNAHINLDLGIAAAEISEGHPIISLDNDFKRINNILASLVNEVQEGLSSIWPFLRKLLRLAGKVDNYIVEWSMELARKGAWKFAVQMSGFKSNDWPKEITVRDMKVADKTRIITEPGRWILFLFWIIRMSERGTVADKIEKLRR